MGYQEDRQRASYYISQGQGFKCPDCYSFVSAGYDYCPKCGAMPQYDNSDDDSGLMYVVSFFGMIVSPLIWGIAESKTFLSYILLLPCAILLYYSFRIFIGMIKRVIVKDNKKIKVVRGIMKILVHLEIFIFNFIAMIYIIPVVF